MILTIALRFLAVIGAVLVVTLLYFLLAQATAIYCATSTTSFSNKKRNEEKSRTEGQVPTSSAIDISFRAIIRCNSCMPSVAVKFMMAGFNDCRTMNVCFGGNSACKNGCLGLGSCAAVCPAGAIQIADGGITITDACNGCGVCRSVCPKNLLEIVPVREAAPIRCVGADIPDIQKYCPTAQTGCTIDYRVFPESGFKKLYDWGIISKKSR